jgi:putative phosphoesterase
MKLLVVADNHGSLKNIEKIMKKETFDVSIHCGDYEMSEKKITKMFDYVVPGNNDIGSSLKKDLKIKLEGLKILITHGDKYAFGTKLSNKMIQEKYGTDLNIVLFGHIHVPSSELINRTNYVNPGSTDLPRNGSTESYAVIEIEDKKVKNIQHKSI